MSFFTRVIFVAVALGMVASGLPVHHKHKHTDVDTVDATVPTSVFSLPSSATGDAVGFAPTPILRCVPRLYRNETTY
jgi:hypothetical protein